MEPIGSLEAKIFEHIFTLAIYIADFLNIFALKRKFIDYVYTNL